MIQQLGTPASAGRRNYKSPWDVLHPGREFAQKLAEGVIPTEDAANIGTTEDDDDES